MDVSTNIAKATTCGLVSFDDGDTARTWEVALPASATGLTKKGAGTLTLSAKPLWTTGAITVEDGAVILPTGTTNYTLGKETVQDTTYTDGIKLVPSFTPYTWLRFNDNTTAGTVTSQAFANSGSCTTGLTVTDGAIVNSDGTYAWQFGSTPYAVDLTGNNGVKPTSYLTRLNFNGVNFSSPKVVWGVNGQGYGGVALTVQGSSGSYTIKVVKHANGNITSYPILSYVETGTGFHDYMVTISNVKTGTSYSRITLYRDGTEVAASWYNVSMTQNACFAFGRPGNNGSTDKVPTGVQIADFRFYQQTLTASQVAKLASTYQDASATLASGTNLWSAVAGTLSAGDDFTTACATSDATLEVDTNAEVSVLEATGVDTIYIPAGKELSVNTLTNGVKITGAGTLVCNGFAPSESTQKTSLQDSDNWTGTVWIKDVTLADYSSGKMIDPSAWGNANSTVRFTGVYGYFINADKNFGGTLDLHNDGDIAAITVSNGFGANTETIGKLTGTGTWAETNTGGAQTIKIGDVSEFRGSFATGNKRKYVFGSTSAAALGSGLINLVSGATNTVASGKTLSCSGLRGAGTLVYEGTTLPSAVSGLTASTWTGTVVFPAYNFGSASTQVALQNYGNTGSKIVLNGLTGNVVYIATANVTVPATVDIRGDVTFNNGSGGKTYTYTKISGDHNLKIVAWSGCSGLTSVVNTFDNYTGTVVLDNEASCVETLKIGNIIVDNAAIETCLLKCTRFCARPSAASVVVDLSSATLNGASANLALEEDGIYKAVAQIGDTYYATLSAAISAVDDSDEALATITVLDTSAKVPNGYTLSGTSVTRGTITNPLAAKLTWLAVGDATTEVSGGYRDLAVNILGSDNAELIADIPSDAITNQLLNVESTLEVAGYPDVISFLIGGTDLTACQDVEETYDLLEELVDQYVALRPYSQVVISTLLPVTNTNAAAEWIDTFNDELRTAAANRHDPFDHDNVRLADIAKAAFDNTFTNAYFNADGVTPNAAGMAKVARAMVNEGLVPAMTAINASAYKIAQVHNGTANQLTVRLSKAVELTTAPSLTLKGTNVEGTVVELSNLTGALGTDKKTITYANTTALLNGDYSAKLMISETEALESETNADFDIVGTGAAANVPTEMLANMQLLETITAGSALIETNSASADLLTANHMIDHVGYYVELKRANEPAQFVWVSMDAGKFSELATKVVLPTVSANDLSTTEGDVTVFGNRGNFTKEVEDGRAHITFTANTTMQVARLTDETATALTADAENLFTYAGFGTPANATLRIGSLKTTDTTALAKFALGQYDVKKIEVWVEPVSVENAVAILTFNDGAVTNYYRNIQSAIDAANGATVTLIKSCTNAPTAGVSYPDASINVPAGLTLTFKTSAADQMISVTNLTGSGTVVVAGGTTLDIGAVKLGGSAGAFAGTITVEKGGSLVVDSVNPWADSATVNVSGTLELGYGAYLNGTDGIELGNVSWITDDDATPALKLVDDLIVDGTIKVHHAYADGVPSVTNVVDSGYVAYATADVTHTEDGDYSVYTFAPRMSGSACLLDYTFTNTVSQTTSSTIKQSALSQWKADYYNLICDSGTKATYLNETNGLYTALKLLNRPYRGKNGNASVQIVPDDHATTVATVGVFPEQPHTVFVSYGAVYTCLFLATGDTTDEIELIRVNSKAYNFKTDACTVLTTMRVPFATSTRHAVVFATEDHQTFKIYLDGTLWCTYKFDAPITLGAGIQLGGWFGGSNNGTATGYGYYNQANDTSAANATVSAIRIYDEALGPNAIASLSKEFPYDSPSIPYDRLLEGDDVYWVQSSKWLSKTEEGGLQDCPDDMARLIITNGIDSLQSLEINHTQSIESLELVGEGPIEFTSSGSEEVTCFGKVTVKTDVVNEWDAIDMFGVPLVIDAGKTLTWNLNTMPVDSYAGTGTTTNRITGVVSGEGTLNLEYPVTKRYTFGKWYNETDSCYYLIVTPPDGTVSTTNGVATGYISVVDDSEAVVTNCTGHAVDIPTGSKLTKLTVEHNGTDITAAFTNCTADGYISVSAGSHVSLELDASAFWMSANGDEINVKPNVTDVTVDGEEVEPMALTGNGATAVFGINAIPGLWYAIETSANGTDWVVDDDSKQQATQAGGLKLTSSKQGDGSDGSTSRVTHYRLRVAPSANE